MKLINKKQEPGFFRRNKDAILVTLLVGLFVTVFGDLIVWGLTKQKDEPQPQQDTPFAPDYRTSSFGDWKKTGLGVNDLIVTDNQVLSLSIDGYKRQVRDLAKRPNSVRDPQGYIEAPVDLSENSFVCSKIYSYTTAIDFSTRLNKKLQVITGDGDDETVGLKLISPEDGYGGYRLPDRPLNLPEGEADPHVDKLNRYHLEHKLPIKQEIVTCLTIHAPTGQAENKQQKKVTVELVVLNNQGQEIDLGQMPTWTVDAPTEINGTNRFSIGLIDSRGDKPVVEARGFCAIKMRDIGDKPSKREHEACVSP